MVDYVWVDEAGEYWPDVLAAAVRSRPRVAPQEHAPQERPRSASPLFSACYGYGWPRDFTLPHVTDEDD